MRDKPPKRTKPYHLPRELPPPKGKRGDRLSTVVGVFAASGVMLGGVVVLAHTGAPPLILAAVCFACVPWLTLAAMSIADGRW